MRDMGKIVTIKQLDKLEGYDRIELASFHEIGERVVVQKGYKVGDLVVFVEADSILPVKDTFEFLRSRCYREKFNGFLIKPMKMAKVISMGIVFPLSILKGKEYKALQNVTEELGIRKKEDIVTDEREHLDNFLIKFLNRFALFRYLFKNKQSKGGSFPTQYISKSDETTIQNSPQLLSDFKDAQYYASIKMEGQSVTALCASKKGKPDTFLICSRNLAYANEKGNKPLWDFALKFDLKNKILNYYKEHGVLLAIQGERCAIGVQKNIYNFNGDKFFVYKIKDITNNKALSYYEMLEVCKELDLQTVPMIETGVLGEAFPTIEACEKRNFYFEDFTKEAFNEKGKGKYHEGYVVRGINNEFSFKVKSKEYQMWFNRDE